MYNKFIFIYIKHRAYRLNTSHWYKSLLICLYLVRRTQHSGGFLSLYIHIVFFLRDPNTKSIHFRNNLFLHRVSFLVHVYRDQIWTLILHPPHHFNTADTNSWTNLKNSISGADIRAVCDRDRPRTLGVPLILGLGWRWAELGEGDVGAPRFKYLWSSIRK